MIRDAFDAYAFFKKHQEAFDKSETFTEFINQAGLQHMDNWIGGWIEDAYATMKAGKTTTYRPLAFPKANKYADLFTAAIFIPTDERNKPQGYRFMSGFSKHCGGTRGWSKRTPSTRSHYGAKFYGTYVKPLPEVDRVHGFHREGYSFEAINREDGILIIARHHNGIFQQWIALLDKSENIETMFDADTQEFIAKERQAELDAWK